MRTSKRGSNGDINLGVQKQDQKMLKEERERRKSEADLSSNFIPLRVERKALSIAASAWSTGLMTQGTGSEFRGRNFDQRSLKPVAFHRAPRRSTKAYKQRARSKLFLCSVVRASSIWQAALVENLQFRKRRCRRLASLRKTWALIGFMFQPAAV